jgi:hypothetical protein
MSDLTFVPTDDLVTELKKRSYVTVIILGRQDEVTGPQTSRSEWSFSGPAVLAWHLCRMMLTGIERSFSDFVPPDFRTQQPPAQEA